MPEGEPRLGNELPEVKEGAGLDVDSHVEGAGASPTTGLTESVEVPQAAPAPEVVEPHQPDRTVEVAGIAEPPAPMSAAEESVQSSARKGFFQRIAGRLRGTDRNGKIAASALAGSLLATGAGGDKPAQAEPAKSPEALIAGMTESKLTDSDLGVRLAAAEKMIGDESKPGVVDGILADAAAERHEGKPSSRLIIYLAGSEKVGQDALCQAALQPEGGKYSGTIDPILGMMMANGTVKGPDGKGIPATQEDVSRILAQAEIPSDQALATAFVESGAVRLIVVTVGGESKEVGYSQFYKLIKNREEGTYTLVRHEWKSEELEGDTVKDEATAKIKEMVLKQTEVDGGRYVIITFASATDANLAEAAKEAGEGGYSTTEFVLDLNKTTDPDEITRLCKSFSGKKGLVLRLCGGDEAAQGIALRALAGESSRKTAWELGGKTISVDKPAEKESPEAKS